MGRLGQAKHMRPSFKMFVKHPDTYRNHHARYTFMHLYTPDSCGTFALFAIHAPHTQQVLLLHHAPYMFTSQVVHVPPVVTSLPQ